MSWISDLSSPHSSHPDCVASMAPSSKSSKVRRRFCAVASCLSRARKARGTCAENGLSLGDSARRKAVPYVPKKWIQNQDPHPAVLSASIRQAQALCICVFLGAFRTKPQTSLAFHILPPRHALHANSTGLFKAYSAHTRWESTNSASQVCTWKVSLGPRVRHWDWRVPGVYWGHTSTTG